MQTYNKNAHEVTKPRRWDKEELSKIVVGCAYKMHVEIGLGLDFVSSFLRVNQKESPS